MIDNLQQIKQMKTIHNNTHESVFRSYNILEQVIEMLKRGDSNKTILEVVHFLTDNRE